MGNSVNKTKSSENRNLNERAKPLFLDAQYMQLKLRFF
jgi:hypothetical protein